MFGPATGVDGVSAVGVAKLAFIATTLPGVLRVTTTPSSESTWPVSVACDAHSGSVNLRVYTYLSEDPGGDRADAVGASHRAPAIAL